MLLERKGEHLRREEEGKALDRIENEGVERQHEVMCISCIEAYRMQWERSGL